MAGALATVAQAQDTRSDSDPTRPILFNVRPELYDAGNGAWRSLFIIRYDTAMMRNRPWLGGRRGMLLRFELPLATASTPSSGLVNGLGDAYGQVLLVPYMSGRGAFVAGSGVSVPTAGDDRLGSGKVTIAPAVAPVWFLRGRGMAYVKLQNFSSVAGDAARPDFSFLLITPTVITRVGRRCWVLADTETKTDWKDGGRTGVKSGIQYGWILPDGLGLWIKPEVWWGPNRGGRWNLKTGIVWYRPAG
jgi:hypothetical protein